MPMPDLNDTLEVFKLLGDPTRVRLLAMLRDQELTVAEMVKATGLPNEACEHRTPDDELAALGKGRYEGCSHNGIAAQAASSLPGPA